MTIRTATADTTDTQIAVAATASQYTRGAPPAVCEHALMHCEYIDAYHESNETMLRQAVRQAREAGHDWMTRAIARRIAAEARRLREQRSQAQAQRRLSEAGRLAKPHQQIVDRVVALSTAAGEQPESPDFYEAVLRAGCPHLDDTAVAAISRVCVHRMTR